MIIQNTNLLYVFRENNPCKKITRDYLLMPVAPSEPRNEIMKHPKFSKFDPRIQTMPGVISIQFPD